MIFLLEEWREDLDNYFVEGGVFINSYNVFDCVPHDLLIAKLEVYSFGDNLVLYIYLYLDNRKQCVRVNNEKSRSKNIISGVPEGSVLEPTLCNLYFHDFLLLIAIALFYDFVDNTSLSNVATTVDSLMETL